MIMETMFVIAGLLFLLLLVCWAGLKELQRVHLIIHETVSNTQVITAAIPQQDFREFLTQMPDVQPWRESDERLDDTRDVN